MYKGYNMYTIRREQVPGRGLRYVVYGPDGRAMEDCATLLEAMDCGALAAHGDEVCHVVAEEAR